MMVLLNVNQLSITFGGLNAVNQLSFQVLHGHIHGLIGPNGAGKTTVFNVISRIYKPDSGKVSLLDQDVLALKPHEVAAAGITRTFQNIELFQNLAIWLAERRPKAVAVDFLEEWASRLVDVKAEDFVADVALLSRGVLLIKGLIGLGQLTKSRVELFAAPVKFCSPVEGSPARIFAIEED
jgi:ABC-type uncharacterized transport system ATPase subunit